MSTDNSKHENSHRTLIKSTSIISAGTLGSRIFGFLRDVVLANLFGTGFRADALFVAFRIPNLFRDFVGEGATNSAIVPVFSEYLIKEKKESFWRFVSAILVLALMALSLITILGVLLAPWIVRLIAPGFIAEPSKLALTIRLTKIVFPYLIFIGLTAYSTAILYTFRSFTVPAFSPCLLNMSIIVSALLSSKYLEEPVYGLAIGILVGGVLQLLVQIRPLMKVGMKLKRPKTLKHPGVSQVSKLLVPRVFGAGVYQLTILIDTFCASLAAVVGVGGISAIYYSTRIIRFPMGIFGLALASAALPTFSALAANQQMDEMKKTLVFSLENIFFVMMPFAVMIIVLANPIIKILFERGEFNAYSTSITSSALLFYGIGLLSFGGIKILVSAFHAIQDTKTPVKIAALCLTINAALNLILMWPMKIAGIAFASSIAASINFVFLFVLINKRLGGGIDHGIKQFVVRILSASCFMAVAIYFMWLNFCFLHQVVRLAVVMLFGLAFYGFLCFRFKIQQAHKIWQWVSRQSV